MKTLHLPLCLCAAAFLMACETQEAGTGTVTVTAYGEDFVEQGIPADAMEDGWTVSFERFEVTFEEVVVAGVSTPLPDPIELTTSSGGEGHAITEVEVPAGSHTNSGYVIEKIAIRGSAELDGVTKTFDWTFDDHTHYAACETKTEVAAGAKAGLELTIHADHLFYDSLASSEPGLRFAALAAADADGNGDITRAELEAADIGAYDPGSDGGIDNLWTWLVAQSQSVGHIDGEGHCDAHNHAK